MVSRFGTETGLRVAHQLRNPSNPGAQDRPGQRKCLQYGEWVVLVPLTRDDDEQSPADDFPQARRLLVSLERDIVETELCRTRLQNIPQRPVTQNSEWWTGGGQPRMRLEERCDPLLAESLPAKT